LYLALLHYTIRYFLSPSTSLPVSRVSTSAIHLPVFASVYNTGGGKSSFWHWYPVESVRWSFFSTSSHSLDPDPDSVTHIPGDGFGPKRLERSAAETIKTDLLFGELELVAERIAPHHLKKPCSVSVLDMMKQYLAGEAEVSALAQGLFFGQILRL